MTAKTPPQNMGASVRARLTHRAQARKENVQLILIRYAIERLLYRLGISPYRDRFILKGAMLFSLWAETPYRSTGDLDLLGYGEATPDRILKIFREVCAIEAQSDGVTFRSDTFKAEVTRPEDEYTGIRLSFEAEISGARLPIQVDIGFGDVVTPAVQEIQYPSLLDLPNPNLRAYPPEAVVAEKYQALVALGMANSRMKDFFDLWAISQTFEFSGDILAQAIHATFAQRETELPVGIPIALSNDFTSNPAKEAQWRGFLRRTAFAIAPPPLSEITERIKLFVLPPTQALRDKMAFKMTWGPDHLWWEDDK